MAQVTIELRNLLKLVNFKLFDFDYNFDDKNMKSKIEQSIIDFYYSYEVVGYTIDEFKHRFKSRYLRIIDYYNSLYNTTILDYNPLINYKLKENTTQKGNATNTSNSQSDTNNKNTDYPQQSISGGNYLSGESKNTDNTRSNTNTNSNSDIERIVESLSGTTYQELIQKERNNIINIINLIIEEMKPCFILVY